LTELDVQTWEGILQARIPLSLFSNLSKLKVDCSPDDVPFFISEMATVIANSPQLKSLDVSYLRNSSNLPTLSELFMETSTDDPLYLDHLSISYMDATVDQIVLPHLTRLTSFRLHIRDRNFSVAQSVWTSFLVNNIKLSDVEIEGSITEETMSYLSSFSGLKRITVDAIYAPPGMTLEILKNMLFTVVLPKHVNSLRTLELFDDLWVELLYFTFCGTFSLTRTLTDSRSQ
jgi:hypothetical protein